MELAKPFVIALLTFAIGGFWYSPVGFLKRWAKESGFDLNAPRPKDKSKHPAVVFGLAYLASVIAVFALTQLAGPEATWRSGLQLGALCGGALVATSFAVNYAFGSKSAVLWLIDAGYHFVQFLAFGAAIGAWH